MKLLFIRHGEPDYDNDCLTPHGREQAAMLRDRLAATEHIDAAFASPMGRASQTAQICMENTGISVEVCPWLREFDVKIHDPGSSGMIYAWDMSPKYRESILCDREKYISSPYIQDTEMSGRYCAADEGLDRILAGYGLVREGDRYRKTAECGETLAFFCHFGMTCVLVSKLLGVSPIPILNGLSCEPTGITTMCTDDRFGEYVGFRMHGYGDISHLSGHVSCGNIFK